MECVWHFKMAKKKESLPLIVNRTAFNGSGRIGSLYDGYHDVIFGTTPTIAKPSYERILNSTQCYLNKTTKSSNLLEILNIDEQLRLSLLLNLTQRTGLAAILDHSHAINDYTRILRYTHLHREERFAEDITHLREYLPLNITELNATHIITNVTWGIDIIVVLQLPSNDQIASNIDQTLEKYQKYLNGEQNDLRRTRDDVNSLEKILTTKIYSNLSHLTTLTSLHDLFHRISCLKINKTTHQPLNYILYPIQCLFHSNLSSNHFYIPVDTIINSKLEQYLYELFIAMKSLEICFNENMQNLLCGHFKERLATVYKRWSIIQNEYSYIVEQFTKLVIEIRSGQIRIATIDKKLRSKTQIEIKTSIQNLAANVSELNAKAHLITELGYQRIQYCNVIEHNITSSDNEETIRQKLIVDETSDRVLCSTDRFNEMNPNLFRQLKRHLLDEYDKNIKIRLIYADFSYSNYPLRNMMILTNKRKVKQNEIQSTPTTIQPTIRSQSNIETLNILLLGETGVGKSTFINSIINYLTYRTFNEAQTNKPLIAITTREHMCKSYIYNLNGKLRLRFIDTPGFGDTRGIDYDHRNLQEISYYIKKYSNLHAVCFLLKPNESRLNIFFRSCFGQLFHLFGENLINNLIFCFTNSRSTFYTPGNTMTLLETMLDNKIVLKKTNVFCFDNESFIQHDRIQFTDEELRAYEQSWNQSKQESFRLIKYIRKKLTPFSIPDESEAIKLTKIKLVYLTHPMLEVMRSMLRNIILRKMHSLQNGIVSCITIDNDENNRVNYQQLRDRPKMLSFLRHYTITNNPLGQKQDELIDHLSLFCYLSAQLSYFLMYIANYRNGDPFLTGLCRLIREETIVCDAENRNYINLQLVDGLKKLTINYEQYLETLKFNSQQTSLNDIDEWIAYIHDYPLIANYVIDTNRIHFANASRVSTV